MRALCTNDVDSRYVDAPSKVFTFHHMEFDKNIEINIDKYYYISTG